jgi:hypothetical protein
MEKLMIRPLTPPAFAAAGIRGSGPAVAGAAEHGYTFPEKLRSTDDTLEQMFEFVRADL